MVADFEAIISGLRNVKNRAIWRRTVGRVRLEAASELRMETSHVVLSVCSSLSGLGSHLGPSLWPPGGRRILPLHRIPENGEEEARTEGHRGKDKTEVKLGEDDEGTLALGAPTHSPLFRVFSELFFLPLPLFFFSLFSSPLLLQEERRQLENAEHQKREQAQSTHKNIFDGLKILFLVNRLMSFYFLNIQ